MYVIVFNGDESKSGVSMLGKWKRIKASNNYLKTMIIKLMFLIDSKSK